MNPTDSSNTWFPGRNWSPAHRVTSVVFGGLGNRLRCITTSLVVAQELGFDLDVFWSRHEVCGYTHFLDLFEDCSIAFVASRPRTPVVATTPLRPRPWFRFRSERRTCLETSGIDGTLYLAHLPQKSFCLKTWHNMKPDTLSDAAFLKRKGAFLSSLHPVREIQSRIDALVEHFSAGTVGVHVRSTDSNFRWRDSAWPDLDLYFAEMRRCLEEQEEATFFVCADDESVVDAFHSRFGKKVRSSNELLGLRDVNRRSKEGQLAAVVDLFCLAKTRKIIGTRCSTFSYEAAALGGLPIVEISGVLASE